MCQSIVRGRRSHLGLSRLGRARALVLGLIVSALAPTHALAMTDAEVRALLGGGSISSAEERDRDYFDPRYHDAGRRWADDYHIKPGLQKLRDGNTAGAFDEFAFVLGYYPNHPQALALLADTAILLGRAPAADPYYRRAFEMYPKSVTASSWKDYGRYLFRAGKTNDALLMLEKAVRRDPTLSEAHYYLGLAYLKSGNTGLANTHAQKAYSGNFPLSELRDRLIAQKAWKPEEASTEARRRAKTQ